MNPSSFFGVNNPHFYFKLGATVFVFVILAAIGRETLSQMGELVHFNCHPRNNTPVLCEFTQEPLIGSKQTRYLPKTDLIQTRLEAEPRSDGRMNARLVLVTASEGALPFTHPKQQAANDQLMAQRPQIDQFLANPQQITLAVRTHYPWQLWGILAGLVLVGSLIGISLWLPGLLPGRQLPTRNRN